MRVCLCVCLCVDASLGAPEWGEVLAAGGCGGGRWGEKGGVGLEQRDKSLCASVCASAVCERVCV